MSKNPGKFNTPEARWAGVGPYYAMFPSRFADRVIERYTDEGDTVLDPFAGRGTAVYSAAITGRHGLGVEINPVGWVYASTKLLPAHLAHAIVRVKELGDRALRYRRYISELPAFFSHCFAKDVLAFLLAARAELDWRNSVVDRTVMAILLIDLHGKRSLAFSNQMRQTKALSPEYAIRWWQARGMQPPERNPVEFTIKKMDWRYARGLPTTTESRVYLADSTHRLPGLRAAAKRFSPNGARLLLTSPPYLGITNYHYDQWLRLWLLGGSPVPRSLGSRHRGKFEHPQHFRELLKNVFSRATEVLSEDATIYVRTDRRDRTARLTRQVLAETFPLHEIRRKVRPLASPSQTRLFGHAVPPVGEVDYILLAPR